MTPDEADYEFKSCIRAVKNSRVPSFGELQEPDQKVTSPEKAKEIIEEIRRANSWKKV